MIMLLLQHLPPIAGPLFVLLIFCAIISAAASIFPSKKRRDRQLKENAGQSSPPSSRKILSLLPALFMILSLTAFSAVDEIPFWVRGVTGGGPPEPPLPAPRRPPLPPMDDQSYEEVRASLVASAHRAEGAVSVTGGYALVTGASSGIGRSIAIQLARRGVSLILIGRPGNNSLDMIAADAVECYGVAVRIVRADLSLPGEARRVHAATSQGGLEVRILILCAGWGPTGSHVKLADGYVERAVGLNVESTAVMASLYGADMVELAGEGNGSKPWMMLVSSIMGYGPGIPGAALYGASKAFSLSLGRSLSLELEPLGVGVMTLSPGATRTNFAAAGGLENAKVWDYPLGTVMDADEVAEGAIEAMIRGRTEYVPGFSNKIMVAMGLPLMPVRLALRLFQFSWAPWNFQWRKTLEDETIEKLTLGQRASVPKEASHNLGERHSCPYTESYYCQTDTSKAASFQYDLTKRTLVVEKYHLLK